jgi:hypothetical protein
MNIGSPEGVMFIAKMLGTAIAVFFGICFFIGLVYGEEGGIKPLRIPDKFDIGYISEEPRKTSYNPLKAEEDEIRTLKIKIQKAKLKRELHELENEKPKTKPVKKQPEAPVVNHVVEDAINALVSLGEKKTQAKLKVEQYIKLNPNANLNQVIRGVYKK